MYKSSPQPLTKPTSHYNNWYSEQLIKVELINAAFTEPIPLRELGACCTRNVFASCPSAWKTTKYTRITKSLEISKAKSEGLSRYLTY